jgi:hypothetical protein
MFVKLLFIHLFYDSINSSDYIAQNDKIINEFGKDVEGSSYGLI